MKPPLAVAILLALALQAGLSFAKDGDSPAKPVGLGSGGAVVGVGAPVQGHPVLVPALAPSDNAAMRSPHPGAPPPDGDMMMHIEPWANSPAVRANAFYVHGATSHLVHCHTQSGLPHQESIPTP